MSIRNLDFLFAPRSVALIGASPRPGSVGRTALRNLVDGGFAGPIFPVNPKYETLEGLRCFPGVDALPSPPDLAVICTPPATVPGLVSALGVHGTRAAVIITSGFGGQRRRCAAKRGP